MLIQLHTRVWLGFPLARGLNEGLVVFTLVVIITRGGGIGIILALKLVRLVLQLCHLGGFRIVIIDGSRGLNEGLVVFTLLVIITRGGGITIILALNLVG